jgi:hypothetical protein
MLRLDFHLQFSLLTTQMLLVRMILAIFGTLLVVHQIGICQDCIVVDSTTSVYTEFIWSYFQPRVTQVTNKLTQLIIHDGDSSTTPADQPAALFLTCTPWYKSTNTPTTSPNPLVRSLINIASVF